MADEVDVILPDLRDDSRFTPAGAEGSVTVEWAAPFEDDETITQMPEKWEVWLRTADQLAPVFFSNVPMSPAVLTGLTPGTTYGVSVRPVILGVPGEFSDEFEVVVGGSLFNQPEGVGDSGNTLVSVPPAPPTRPTLETLRGGIIASWDGKLESGFGLIRPGAAFAEVYAEVSPNGVDWVPEGASTPSAGQLPPITNLIVGQQYQVRLRAWSKAGLRSEPSPVATVTVQGIKGPDIEANSVTANSIAAGAIDGMTITGALFRTSVTGQRMQWDMNGIRSFNSSNAQTALLAPTPTGMALTGTLVGTGDIRGPAFESSNTLTGASFERTRVEKGTISIVGGLSTSQGWEREVLIGRGGLSVRDAVFQGPQTKHAIYTSNEVAIQDYAADAVVYLDPVNGLNRGVGAVLQPVGTILVQGVPIGDTGWITIPRANASWNVNPASTPLQYKVLNGVVYLKGVILCVNTTSAVVADLPAQIAQASPFVITLATSSNAHNSSLRATIALNFTIAGPIAGAYYYINTSYAL